MLFEGYCCESCLLHRVYPISSPSIQVNPADIPLTVILPTDGLIATTILTVFYFIDADTSRLRMKEDG